MSAHVSFSVSFSSVPKNSIALSLLPLLLVILHSMIFRPFFWRDYILKSMTRWCKAGTHLEASSLLTVFQSMEGAMHASEVENPTVLLRCEPFMLQWYIAWQDSPTDTTLAWMLWKQTRAFCYKGWSSCMVLLTGPKTCVRLGCRYCGTVNIIIMSYE